MTRKRTKLIHEGKYAAEVPVELIEDDTAWSPYQSPQDVRWSRLSEQIFRLDKWSLCQG